MSKGPGSVYNNWNISWSSVTQIFHKGQLSIGGDRKLSNWWLQQARRTRGSVAFYF